MRVFLYLVYFLFFLCATETQSKPTYTGLCQMKYRFSKLCKFFDFESSQAIENGCHPSLLKNCKTIKIKRNEPKCPFYDCKVKQSV